MSTIDPEGPRTAAVIVAHPDDETLWAGGIILSRPTWRWHIVTLCRASDADRAPRFYRAVHELGAAGMMADLDDGPEQAPLDERLVRTTILGLLSPLHFDLVISHDPAGEYTRHRRHEETARAVISLWQRGQISAAELWTFAYEDHNKRELPQPVKTAPVYQALAEGTWRRKYAIITETYGFTPDSFEAQTTPRAESFWQFTDPAKAVAWLEQRGHLE